MTPIHQLTDCPPAPLTTPTFEKRIMVVEDDPGMMGLYRLLLHAHGYRVLGAEDGEEALHTLLHSGTDIDLLIVDLGLPRVGGIEVINRLRSAGLTSPVIVCSGMVREDVGEDLERVGATRFLRKPFRNSEMIGEVERALAA